MGIVLAQLSLNDFVPEIGVIVLIVGISVVLHAMLQRYVKPEVLRRNNEVAAPLFSAVGVIYAVLLGFVVVVVWEKYDNTVTNVDTEISAVTDLYRVVGGFPDPLRLQIRHELADYVDSMIQVEWPSMEHHHAIPKNLQVLESIATQVDRFTFTPKTPQEAEVHQMAMAQMERLFDARRLRLVESAPSVPGVLWAALTAGGIAILAFAYFFGVENRPAQLAMTAILAGLIAILFIVISDFDAPFRGSVGISGGGWVFLKHHLSQIP